MSTEPHYRAYLNPQAALSEAAQKALVEKYNPAETYVEGRSGGRKEWIDSLREGNFALLPELFVLAKATGGKDKRYADLLIAADCVRERGAVIVEASSWHRMDDKKQRTAMWDRAYAMLDSAVRLGKSGKPPLGFTERELEVMQAIMTSRHYGNWETRQAAMEARGIKKAPGRTWCLTELPKLAAKLGSVVEITAAVPKFRKAPTRKQLHPPSQIYFIQCGEAVKIGISVKPYERIANLSSANHQKMELLATMDGGRKEEKAMHAKFASYRIKSEWFRYSAEIDKFIKTIVRKHKRK